MKNLAFLFLLFLSATSARSQTSSGVFCTDLNQVIHYAPDNFSSILGETLAVKTGTNVKEWKSTLILAGTLSATVAQGPETGIWHYYTEMNTGKEILAANSFRDNLAIMSSSCLEALDFKVTETKIKQENGTEAIEQIMTNYDFPAARQMKIVISIQQASGGDNLVKFDLLFKP